MRIMQVLCVVCLASCSPRGLFIDGVAVPEFSIERVERLLSAGESLWPSMERPQQITIDPGLRMMGNTWDATHIFVRPFYEDGSPVQIEGSTLLHECAHVTYWLHEGGPDADHSVKNWDAVEQWNDAAAQIFLRGEHG